MGSFGRSIDARYVSGGLTIANMFLLVYLISSEYVIHISTLSIIDKQGIMINRK